MLRFIWLTALATGLLAFLPAAPPAEKLTTDQLLTRLTDAIDDLKTLRCNVRAQERIGSSYQQARTSMKMTLSPLRVYLKNQKGIEVLWVTGQNDGDAWVYPNSFPYVTLSLDPNGTLMRRNQHHSVLDAGFGTIADIIRGSNLRQDRAFDRSFHYDGDTLVAGHPCYVLRSEFPQFRYVTYKAGKGETVARVAARFGCGEYRIMERNSLSAETAIPEGKVLQVPNAYGRRTIICIDQKLFLPISVQVFDDKGLFEKFDFSEVVANQPIPLAEFNKDYKGYKL
ncbi:DUF1571 domain-containing protein [Hymenobacter jejuensis]|uniref:DUF1571 domain-containing protein n=1 Tax=Hymenobacter jejuensis TaxID=2502781 RepID=A0A5B8A3R0_9BACT|nr:DUF1571 domain-containing protein [Hymenobacter jejuensis]QDA61769.1 DUF1571 domain-containing protein [Hymenobacter jejuensis]